MRLKTPGEVQPVSAWLFNSIANKHADAMDNYPMPSVLPREAADERDAKQLSAILPVILEQNDYEQVYSDKWWYKLKTGTGVEGVFWNPAKLNGLGDIEIRPVDLLNLFWEPGVKDIQASRHFFHVELTDNDVLEQQYPELKGKLGGSAIDVSKYLYDETVDTSKKTAVVDWYYKARYGSKDVLHYCKFVNDAVLYASEDDPAYAQRGFYDHGRYPFVFDVLFLEEGMPTGFGYIDIMKDPQMYIDKLNQVILTNALMTGKKRFFIRHDGAVNEEEFADWSKDFVHVAGSNLGEDSIREITVAPLSSMALNMLQHKIDEMKETSGNRDFSQGGTNGGVTAASAIAALQEAGSKLSRDMIKSSYRAFVRLNTFCLELIRQFYDEPRCFRITGENGAQEFVQYDNGGMIPQNQGAEFGVELGVREPVFDIKITSQKSSPFSRIAQNELAKEFYGMGFFNPEAAEQALLCMEMMDFEGKDIIMQRVTESITKQQQAQQAQMAQMQQMQQMAQAQQMQGAVGTPGMGAPQAAAGQGGAPGPAEEAAMMAAMQQRGMA
ncbi:MAG: portal protein [Christensenellales bacterium]